MSEKQTVKFGDICREVKLTTKDPIADGYDKYIGLEHLDTGSLQIKRWGSISEDKPTFTRIFKKGQILFGKRRSYLKKAAVAEFDGICSGDIIVMEPKSDLILPGLLPFIVQSEKFWDWAIKTSSGSLSPRTKFKELSEYELNLPPTQDQSKLLHLMERCFKNIELVDQAISGLFILKNSFSKELFLGGNDFNTLFGRHETYVPEKWNKLYLGDVITKIQYGTSDELHVQGNIPVFRMMNIEEGKIVASDLKYSKLGKDKLNNIILHKGDILFNRTNSIDLVGKTGIFKLDGDYIFASYLLRVNVNTEILTPDYLNGFINLPVVQYRLKAFATPGVSQANINPDSLKRIPFLLPPLAEVRKSDLVFAQLDKQLAALRAKRFSIQNLMSTIKEKFLTG